MSILLILLLFMGGCAFENVTITATIDDVCRYHCLSNGRTYFRGTYDLKGHRINCECGDE